MKLKITKSTKKYVAEIIKKAPLTPKILITRLEQTIQHEANKVKMMKRNLRRFKGFAIVNTLKFDEQMNKYTVEIKKPEGKRVCTSDVFIFAKRAGINLNQG